MTRNANPSPAEALRSLRLPYVIYQVAAHLLAPLLIGVFLWRSRREPLYRAHFGERFGSVPRSDRSTILVFSASLGETRAASPLIRRLLDEGHRVWLAHSSPAGRSEGQRIFADDIAAARILQSYMPLDLFWCVRRAFVRARPSAVLVVEAEIWPALVFTARRAGIPVVQVNGSLNETTVARSQSGLSRLRLAFLSAYDLILTKSERFAANYRAAGVPDDRIRMPGELKFDIPVDPSQRAAGRRLKSALPADRPVFLIASSVTAEEDALVAIAKRIAALPASPLIVWAPRSPQRFDAVAKALSEAGLTTLRRSACLGPALEGDLPPSAQALVGDSIGEMPVYYELSDLVFVGASLNDDGGHNIVEPLQQGRPVVMGPSTYGIVFPAVEAALAGAFESLPDADAVARRVETLLSDPGSLAEMAERARTFGGRHIGAADRSLDALRPYLCPADAPAG